MLASFMNERNISPVGQTQRSLNPADYETERVCICSTTGYRFAARTECYLHVNLLRCMASYRNEICTIAVLLRSAFV